MNITGIIVEYNPLHKGHIHHIKTSKKITNCDGVICVMSGNFVQRGMPALLDKWSRTKAALECGVDLVIELPLIYSISSAEFFAFGAVSLLNNLGVVNNLCFGSECGNINDLCNIAKILYEESSEFKNYLKLYLKQGLSYPVSRSKALVDVFNENINANEILSNSNNILAIEYCKSLLKTQSSITPYTVKRIGSLYNEPNLNNSFSSATSIRNHIQNAKNIQPLKDILPLPSFNIIEKNFHNKTLVFKDSIFPYVKYRSLTEKNTLENLLDVSEGLHNKIYKSLQQSNSYEDLIIKSKSKRYTYTRISRILCQYFLGLDKYNIKDLITSPAPYARVLGFNNTGREILRNIKSNTSIPLYTKLPKNSNTVLDLDIRGTMAYSMLNKSLSPHSDFITSPIVLI